MEWSKIKNIIILILLLLNGFLLLLVAGREVNDSRSAESARLAAIQVIQDSGVALPEEIVPRNMQLQPAQFTRDLELEAQLAERLLGGQVTVEARGGEVYRYHNTAGSIQFHSGGEFLAQLEPGNFPLGEQSVTEHATAILALLDFSGDPIETTFVDGDGSITFRQTLNGVPLLGCQATLHYTGGRLVSIAEGKRLTGTPSPDSRRSTISVATALMCLFNSLKDLGDIYSEIDDIAQAYSVSVSLTGPAQLTPVWYVKTDTGAYQMDVVSGELSRAVKWPSSPAIPNLNKDFNSLTRELSPDG